jgi:DnaJ homologue, subfamily C, member 28, conserved domain
MTERKPPGMSFRSWIDQQISEAEQRGAFDDLPGAGKPIPSRGEADDGQAWLRDYLRREGVSTHVVLPTPLRLRRESELLAQTVHTLRSEPQVREAVAELNERIISWRRLPVGPPIFVPLVDCEEMLRRWHDAQAATAAAGTGTAADAGADRTGGSRAAGRRWWRPSRRSGRRSARRG